MRQLHQRRQDVLRNDSSLLRLHDHDAQGRLLLLSLRQQQPRLLRHLLKKCFTQHRSLFTFCARVRYR
jgi:hypothetical protein